ncbi:MAG: ferric reductase-like transmembrane domain-containing protein [Actinomycetota bacterium]
MPRPIWNRFSLPQLLVLAIATVAPLVISGVVGARLLGSITTETMLDLALAAGEDPGMITFGAMFLASPVQWVTGRSQVRVRKHLGIVFALLAISNGAMFVIESGLAAAIGAPFLVAGSIALLISLPLLLTSSRRAQRRLGLRRWRLLHRATYLVAVALVAHVALIPEFGIGATLISIGFAARLPPVRRRLERVGAGDRRPTSHRPGDVRVPADLPASTVAAIEDQEPSGPAASMSAATDRASALSRPR